MGTLPFALSGLTLIPKSGKNPVRQTLIGEIVWVCDDGEKTWQHNILSKLLEETFKKKVITYSPDLWRLQNALPNLSPCLVIVLLVQPRPSSFFVDLARIIEAKFQTSRVLWLERGNESKLLFLASNRNIEVVNLDSSENVMERILFCLYRATGIKIGSG